MRRLALPGDLVIVLLVAAVAVAIGLADVDAGPLRIVLGVPLALVLPGYALTEAAVSRRAVAGIERALLAVGLSLCLGATSVLLVNLLPYGVTRTSWLGVAGSVTVIASAVAARRRPPRAERPAKPRCFRPSRGRSMASIAGGALAAAVTVLAVVLAAHSANRDTGRGFTELAMVRASAGTSAHLSVTSQERGAERLTVTVTRAGVDLRAWALTLAPGEHWSRIVPIAESRARGPVEARVYRPGLATPYRTTVLWP